MKIATWNVNSVRARLDRLVPWLDQHRPDVLCLQETKVIDEMFPFEHLEDQGYNVEVFGQKTYNGVAILASHDIEAVTRGFVGDDDSAEKRAIGCVVGDFAILNLYVPNGREVGCDKYDYKLRWLKQLREHMDATYQPSDNVIVLGDFNITFDDRDIYAPDKWHERILCSKPERDALAHVMDWGLHDSIRKFHEGQGPYTWWDLRTRGFDSDEGLRIDHQLMSASALERCVSVEVDREARAGRSPSDHAPVVATFE